MERDIQRLTNINLKGFNYEEDKINAQHGEYLEAQREAMAKLHVMLFGVNPTKQQIEGWKKKNIKELIKETKEWPQENANQLLQDIKIKKSEIHSSESLKTNILVIATVIQVVGIVLIYLGENSQNQKLQ
jgi:hypothetical protein